ncbi:MAG: M23 family metallopeptidase [Pseudomonadota bacterium]
MFLRNDHGLDQGGGASAVARAHPASHGGSAAARMRARYPEFELVPDLGSRIGSMQWYRGAATCVGLIAVTLLLSPGFERPIFGYVPPALTGGAWEAAREQAIAPLAAGATTGHRAAATALVAPLADTPERPRIELDIRFGSGDAFASTLRRSGVGSAEAQQIASLVAGAIALSDIQSNAQGELVLGRRTDKSQPRPLESLLFRPRFDLNVAVTRVNGQLVVKQLPIAIDHTPLRIRMQGCNSLYRTARAAGAPAKAVEAYIRAINTRMPMSRLGGDCTFDMIIEQQRAETGEVQLGQLLYAGVAQGSTKVQLMRWQADGRDQWFDSTGLGEKRGTMAMPASGRISSPYGVRFHPILRRRVMHKGLDIAAPYGSPIYAANDGVVIMAGRAGGYGNFVKINHGSGFATGYGHMSRIAVRSGARVRKGQLIGYVGSTGRSTGPHLHFETYRNGVAVNPASISFTTQQRLTGGALGAFKGKLGHLLAVPVADTAKPDDD